MTFNDAAVTAVYAALESHAKAMNRFQDVNMQEPAGSPATGLYCTIVVGPIQPFAAGSGLRKTTGRIEFHVVVWSQAAKRQVDPVDPKVLSAALALMAAYNADFDLGGLIRNVDVMQVTGMPGWIEFSGSQCRAIDVTLPLVINDMFTQEATGE